MDSKLGQNSDSKLRPETWTRNPDLKLGLKTSTQNMDSKLGLKTRTRNSDWVDDFAIKRDVEDDLAQPRHQLPAKYG